MLMCQNIIKDEDVYLDFDLLPHSWLPDKHSRFQTTPYALESQV